MGKLRALAPLVGRLSPMITTLTDAEGHADGPTETWRGWYKLAAWARLRRRVFKRDDYACQWEGCGKVTANPVADHVIRHGGDAALFWDDTNVQTLCKPCHDKAKQALERAERTGGGSKI